MRAPFQKFHSAAKQVLLPEGYCNIATALQVFGHQKVTDWSNTDPYYLLQQKQPSNTKRKAVKPNSVLTRKNHKDSDHRAACEPLIEQIKRYGISGLGMARFISPEHVKVTVDWRPIPEGLPYLISSDDKGNRTVVSSLNDLAQLLGIGPVPDPKQQQAFDEQFAEWLSRLEQSAATMAFTVLRADGRVKAASRAKMAVDLFRRLLNSHPDIACAAEEDGTLTPIPGNLWLSAEGATIFGADYFAYQGLDLYAIPAPCALGFVHPIFDMQKLSAGIGARQTQTPVEAASRYVPPYIEYMLWVVEEFGVSKHTRPDPATLETFIKHNWPDSLPGYSDKKANMMSTFIRRPEHGRGGNRPQVKAEEG